MIKALKFSESAHTNSLVNSRADCSQTIRQTGRFAVGCNAFAAFSILLYDHQSGGHGEMGSFYHSLLVWILVFAGWGIATGIGLMQAWRWARISTLIFSGLLVGLGLLGIVAIVRLTAASSGLNFRLLTVLPALLAFIPLATGIWWLVFFSRKDVKAYFQADRKSA